ncbi:hypothetical protein HYH03_009578 [Edaphochlamys debaryana]|uniref:USP domain-containing protein n=1 Tax=Edaphochlamys debaryana TaxID=47281 RepID=A0A835XYR8_9CHLO|nr:hypothetical protein HYH03_009578 [Edaphochlamys debaryana]|eukprot:KAG2492082.1 hypothetical protein HYH03_009578 [Edaphochlamys debaryana]
MVDNLTRFGADFEVDQQEDSHEFLLAVLNGMESDAQFMGGQLHRTIVGDLFRGDLRSSVRCEECGNVSSTHQPFTALTALSLPIVKGNGVRSPQQPAPPIWRGA